MTASKMLPCQACCPARPERGYYTVGKVRHERDHVEINGEFVWAWKCWNCGNIKKPRKSNKPTYDEITGTLTSDKKLSRSDQILFHCFNPNGLYAELKAVQDRIGEWVDAHPEQPNGVLLVHGSMNDYPRKLLFAMLDKRKRIGRIDYAVSISTVERAIKDAKEWLAKKSA